MSISMTNSVCLSSKHKSINHCASKTCEQTPWLSTHNLLSSHLSPSAAKLWSAMGYLRFFPHYSGQAEARQGTTAHDRKYTSARNYCKRGNISGVWRGDNWSGGVPLMMLSPLLITGLFEAPVNRYQWRHRHVTDSKKSTFLKPLLMAS